MAGSGFRPAPQINPAELGRLGTAPGGRRPESAQLFDVGSSRSANHGHRDESDITGAGAESPQVVDLDGFQAWWRRESLREAAESPPRRWKLTPAARALVGVVAIVGSVFAIKVAVPGSGSFADNGAVDAQFPGGKAAAASSDTGALSGTDSAQPAQDKIGKEQLVDLSTQASPASLPAGGSGDVRRIQPTAGASNTTAVAQEVDTSPVASLSSQPSSEQAPGLGPARTVSSTPGATVGVVGTVTPTTPKLHMPTKRPGKVTNRVAVGNVETTAAPDAPSEPLAKPAKPEEASAPKSAQAVAVANIAQAAPPEGGKQPVNPLWRAIGELFGARVSPAKQPIDPTPTTLTRWAVQLATQKTEEEAKSALKRLNAKYASALNGSTIRLHEARVDGETAYRLRVVGLSKGEATLLCERLKGDGGSCFIVR